MREVLKHMYLNYRCSTKKRSPILYTKREPHFSEKKDEVI